MISNKFIWWMGVVEDREDPEHMGRLRVRIFGTHSHDKGILPTKDLPWAVVMHPINSAALSGIGIASVGPLPGTWCVGFYLDGDEFQQPFVFGTLGGFHESTEHPEMVIRDLIGNTAGPAPRPATPPPVTSGVVSSDGKPVLDGSGQQIQTSPLTGNVLPPLTEEQVNKLINAIGFRESSNNYRAVNRIGFVGRYQFGAAALSDLGYIKRNPGETMTNAMLRDPNRWTGKDGLRSLENFYDSPQVQDKIMFANMQRNYNTLIRNGTITQNDKPERVAGLITVAHLLGAGGATKYGKSNVNGSDANGTSAASYYELGAKAIGSTNNPVTTVPPPVPPSTTQPNPTFDPSVPVDAAGALNSSLLQSAEIPFVDPEGTYPRKTYDDYPDLNKLAYSVTDRSTYVPIKDERRILGIPRITGLPDWDEPPVAYCGEYPHNLVFETEGGHFLEVDSTPEKERIHVYHKTGSYDEYFPEGDHVQKIVGNNFLIYEKNNKVYVMGAADITVDGPARILVRNDATVETTGDLTLHSHQNLNLYGKNILLSSPGITSFRSSHIHTVGAVLKHRPSYSDYPGLNSGTVTSVYGRQPSGGPALWNSPKYGGRSSSGAGEYTENFIECEEPETYFYDEGEAGAAEYAQGRINQGTLTPTTPIDKGEETPATNADNEKASTTQVACEEFASFKEFPNTIRLSQYFTLGELSANAPVVKQPVIAQRDLSKAQIVCNLKKLAVNVLDKIKEKYPNMFVTNAFRPVKSGTSDHEIGLAADLQFKGISKSEYYDIAVWIKDNIPYSQLLLEYSNSSNNPWIHIAFNTDKKYAFKVGTFNNHATYAANKLVNLAA